MEEKDKRNNYQVMPPLTDEEYESLKEDIEEHGVMVPVEIDEEGNILDGYHRVKACQELGITDYPTILREGWSEGEKYEHAFRLNVRRRNLSGEQLKEVIRNFKEKHPTVSNRQVANAINVSPTTVRSAVDEVATVQSGQLQKTTGADGKNRPSSEIQAEKQRQEIRDAIKKNPEMNNHQIAQSLGVSDHTVQKQRQTIENESKADELTVLAQEEKDIKDDTSPYGMNSVDDILQLLLDEAASTKEWLSTLITDYEWDKGKERILSSPEGIEACLQGLNTYKEAIDKAVDEAVAYLHRREQGLLSSEEHKEQR